MKILISISRNLFVRNFSSKLISFSTRSQKLNEIQNAKESIRYLENRDLGGGVGEKSRKWMEGERTWSDECSSQPLSIDPNDTDTKVRVRQLDFNKRCVSTLVPSK